MYHVSIMYDGWVLMCVLEDLAFRNESDVCFVKNWNMAMAQNFAGTDFVKTML